MEVPGKREKSNVSCKPCEESEIRTQAEGFCTSCDEYMCTSCFDTHKKWKLNREHTLIDCNEKIAQRESANEFENCEQHSDEPVKFYCVQHEQVGCGDCMSIGHRSCKVDYILNIKGTPEFDSLTKGPEKCKVEAKHVLSSIKNNIVQVDDISEKFKQDVYQFWEEITTQINNLKECMLKEGECIKAKDNLKMRQLQDETESLINDLNVISDSFESTVESPCKHFVCSVSHKPRLDKLRNQLDDIKSKSNIQTYEFKTDNNLTRALASAGQLGILQKDKEKHLKDQEENKQQQNSKTLKASGYTDKCKADSQPLLDRQLICTNIKVDEFTHLSYVENKDGDVGLYVDKNRMLPRNYFEIKILSLGKRGTIAIGLVPDSYPANMQPGWGHFSIGYHAHDGWRGKNVETVVNAIFTRNGTKAGEKKLSTGPLFNLYPAVGMHSPGEKVKVIFHTGLPASIKRYTKIH